MNDSPEPEHPAVAMQTHCLGCLREHWAPTVPLVSEGGTRCACGHISRTMTDREYREALAERRQQP